MGLLLAPATVEECSTVSGHAVRYAERFQAPVGLYLDPVLAETLEAIPEGAAALYEGLTGLPLASATEVLSQRWSEVHLPPGARVGVVAWGGTRGAVRDASLVAENLRVRLAHLHPRMLAPAPDGELRSFLGSVLRILVAEPEPSAPLSTYLETRFGAVPERLIWPLGSPLTPEAVLRALRLPG